MNKNSILRVLEKELVVALGCTEPVSIALAAATARDYMKGDVQSIEVLASINVIKNAMAVGIPGMKATGIDFVAALGVLLIWFLLCHYFSYRVRKSVLRILAREKRWMNARGIRANLRQMGLYAPPPSLFFALDWLKKKDLVCWRLRFFNKGGDVYHFMVTDEGMELYRKEYAAYCFADCESDLDQCEWD